jgi:hypothetical protein
VQIAPWIFKSSNPRSLGYELKQCKAMAVLFRQRRSPAARSEGRKGAGAHEGSVAPRVDGWGGRNDRSRRGPEVAAEGSPSTARLRR